MEELQNMHIYAINQMVEKGEMIPTKSIGIKLLNLEEFQFYIKGNDGVVNMAEFIKIKKFIDSSISSISWACRTFMTHHKDSPYYWGKIEKDSERNMYNVSIDLEAFMEESSKAKEIYPGYSIPDNYHLAKEVMKKFKKAGNSVKEFEDDSFRDCANWYVKDKKSAKKLVDFIEETYVSPYIKELMEFYNVKEIKFLTDRMDFFFNEKELVTTE